MNGRRTRRSALARLAAVTTVVVAALGVDGPSGGATAATTAARRLPAPPVVTLLGQSTWVRDGKVFDLRLGLAPGLAPTDRVEVTAYSRLTTRTEFDQAAAGQYGQQYDVWNGQETVADAPRARHGGVWARIPVDAPVGPGDLTTVSPFSPGSQSGVYPLRIQVLGAAYEPIGAGVSTFLVYDAGQTGFPRLSVSLTVPVGAAPTLSPDLVTTRLDERSSASVAAVTAVLAAHPGVRLTLAVVPQTAESLRDGTAADRVTLRRLVGLIRRGDELPAAPYVQAPLAPLDAAGLDAQIDRELQSGRAATTAAFGSRPDPRTWVVDEPVDDSTLQLLRRYGLRQLIVPDASLSPLPAALVRTTYGRPTALADGIDAAVRVFGADPVLARRARQPGDPVLAAEQTLAEMAMTELETPSVVRGVAVSLRASTPPAYLSSLLDGLQGNPFVEAVTADGLFSAVPAVPAEATPSSATGAPGGPGVARVPVRHLRPVPIAEAPAAGDLQQLDAEVSGLDGFLTGDAALIGRLRRELLLAPAVTIPTSVRTALLGSVAGVIRSAETSVRLPGDTSVTLTSLKATLPLIVLSDPRLRPHVRLVLDSPKLGFRTYRPYGGSCTVIGRTSEICQLVLHGPQTTLRVPVEARTSGVFSLDVALSSPDGSLALASARDTVRSTAVSFVGLVIIVGSVLFLGIWWIRDIRSGRRARQLVRRPGDDLDGDDPDDDDSDGDDLDDLGGRDGDDDGDDGPSGGGSGGDVGPRPPGRDVGPSAPVPAPTPVSAPTVFGPPIRIPVAASRSSIGVTMRPRR